MNTITNSNGVQGVDMTPDETMANLAFVTKLSEGLMPKQMPEEPQEALQESSQTPETAPEQEQIPETTEDNTQEPQMDEYNAKLDVLSQDITSVKEMLQQLLNKDEKLPE